MLFLRDVMNSTKRLPCRHNIDRSLASCTFQLSSPNHIPRKIVNPNSLCCGAPLRQLQRKAGAGRVKSFTPQYKWDRVPSDFDVIYVSSLRHWIGISRIGMNVLTVSVCGVALFKVPQMALEALPSAEGFFLCAAPLLTTAMTFGLHYLSRPIVKRIYHNAESGQMICVRRTFLGRLKQINYDLQDVYLQKKLKKATEVSWDSINVKIKNTPVFLLSSDFTDLAYYNWHVEGHGFQGKSLLAKQQFY